ncbi:hypothetical protein FRC02_011416 [Tulasnella sp. 418]|nr:hypothetical protein FRC02_011416 [Tulasnella sp. 418]
MDARNTDASNVPVGSNNVWNGVMMPQEVSGTSRDRTPYRNWEENFGRIAKKNDPIWAKYVDLAIAYDKDVIDAVNRSMDILLVFSGLFCAVVTTFLTQAEQESDQQWKLPQMTSTDVISHLLRRLPGARNPSDEESRHSRLDITITLWYISLYCALLVAGGAVCLKLWLLEYQRSNRRHRVPYYRAIHHQQNLASLRRWNITEFGDLLGSVTLLNLIPFLSGFLTYPNVSDILSGFVLTVYTASIAFTTIVGVLLSSTPYHTPISNLLKASPAITRPIVAVNRSMLYLALAASVCSTIASYFDYGIIGLPVLLALLLVMAWLQYQNVTEKLRGVRLFFVALLGMSGMSAASLVAPKHSSYFTFLPIAAFICYAILIQALSRRYSMVKNPGSFPVTTLFISAFTTVGALYLLWSPLDFMPQLSSPLLVGAALSLGAAFFYPDVPVKEDATESETIGWLISQTTNPKVLHDALTCIPSISNTPFRRQVLLKSSLHTLASLLDSLIDDLHHTDRPRGRDKDGTSMRGRDGGQDMDDESRESRMKFYLACLAEISHTTAEGWQRLVPENRWHDFTNSKERLGHFYHLSSASFTRSRPPPPLHLQTNLKTLSAHQNFFTSTISRVLLIQLYPRSFQHIPWPKIPVRTSEQMDFSSSYLLLTELRSATTRVTNLYRDLQSLEPSVQRHLYRYCGVALDLWATARLSENDEVFEVGMDLAYVIFSADTPSDVLVMASGASASQKAARCLTALQRRLDRRKVNGGTTGEIDTPYLRSISHSIVSAIDEYLKHLRRDATYSEDIAGVEGVDEYPMDVGLQCLDDALLEIALQRYFPCLIEKVVTTIQTFYSIEGERHISSRSWVFQRNAAWLITHFAFRAASTSSPTERVAALRAAGQILHKASVWSTAWYLAMAPMESGQISIPSIIKEMARDSSVECRLAALSILEEVHIFCPSKANFNSSYNSKHQFQESEEQDTSASLHPIRLKMLNCPDSEFEGLYEDLLRDPSPLLQAIDTSSFPPHEALISKSISITTRLVHCLPPDYCPSTLLRLDKYPRTLLSIASHEDSQLVPMGLRASAIQLLAYLWHFADVRRCKQNVALLSGFDNICKRELLLGGVAKAVNLVIGDNGGLSLDCITMWVERLEVICSSSWEGARIVATSKLVEALMEAVICADLGEPVESRREGLLTRLYDLRDRIGISAPDGHCGE